MKTIFVLIPFLSVALAQNNGGFLSGITGAFNNFFGSSSSNSGPAQQQQPARRPPQQQFQQQQFQPQQQQQQQFQPQPPQQQFAPRPSVQQGSFQPVQSRPANPPAPAFRPQSQRVVSQTVSAPAPAPSQSQSTRVTGGTSLCGAAAPNHFWTDPRDNKQRGYVATWKIGCTTFQQHEARAYCNSMNMEPVSLDSPAKQDAFNRLIAQDAQRYFWTGGIVDHANKVVNWANSRAAPVPFSASAHWSHTGGAGLPQPDNRAAGENPPNPETCLGILNNFYADGIKWHDVACHHKKPTVCEPRN
eukprot:TRINITY_DN551_c0_g1_i2.p1 TRINITY_DN551_c0_g1~~TRINITY_DN551_c0_g1_i2.p1  ORF type:complete len:302 (+),score=73.12 TRINITY_DN551_c0_g1_i2:33-938(+)